MDLSELEILPKLVSKYQGGSDLYAVDCVLFTAGLID
jgi:hypothetical protein